MRPRNLLEETRRSLGGDTDQVQWVGSADGKLCMSWDEFAEIAKGVEYDSGYGSQKIASDLVVVLQNGWLERHEYDGCEWWEHKHGPIRASDAKSFATVCNGGMWESLAEMNRLGNV